MNVRTQFEKRRSPASGAGQGGEVASCRQTALRTERGVALIITLIFLAVITTLAIAFLAITQRETGAVDVMGKTTDAELAADSALERAKAEILAPFTFRNSAKYGGVNGSEVLGPDFMVSVNLHTNRISSAGAWRNPSPPVFVDTNRNKTTGPFDDRFYLDLNRNGFFEGSGYVRDIEVGPFGTNAIHWRVGDPQWVGVLQDPRRVHTNDNRYIGRYAFMVQPIGRSLDANWIHNEGISRSTATPGFYREQGVGSWEINFAAFLADLNTNQWGNLAALPYSYTSSSAPGSIGGAGDAFADARDFLFYRYGPGLQMDLANGYFPVSPNLVLEDQIDLFANGFSSNANPDDNDDLSLKWPGANNRTNLATLHDFLTKFKKANGFGTRLANASTRNVSEDRYTYYRMFSQLGTDSAAEDDESKININYVNIPSWTNTGVRYRVSDMVRWSDVSAQFIKDMGRPGPELFFLSAVTNLLAREPELASFVTNRITDTVMSIPIYTNRSTFTTNLPFNGPLYSARLHQLLQITANIFDATITNKQGERYPFFPSVFRPVFYQSNDTVFITDYVMQTNAAPVLAAKWRDLEVEDIVASPILNTDLVYGIPLIIGARQGLPSFSELGVVSTAQATRKVTLYRATAGKDWDKLEQQFSLKVRSMIQLEARNPSTNPYPRPLTFAVGLNAAVQIKSASNGPPVLNSHWITGTNITYALNSWPGEPIVADGSKSTNHFRTSPLFLTNLLNYVTITNADGKMPTNQWSLALTNRLLFFLIDQSSGRIIDAVTLNRPHNVFEIGRLMEEDLPKAPAGIARIWSSADAGKYSLGIRTQFDVSANPGILGAATSTGEYSWGNYDNLTALSRDAAAQHWREFFGDNSKVGTNQAPFTPSRLMVQANYYQVNDPLVHYTFDDLRNDPQNAVYGTEPLISARTNLSVNIGQRNRLSLGWNKGDFNPESGETPGQGTLDPTMRDPGVIHPATWNFPTNLFPSLGWLGRVHRGTPWQTIYLKSRPVYGDWIEHTGNQRANYPNAANQMQPVRDWELLDVFTTAPHPNATRGRLSINQTNVAAWSAVLSGVFGSTSEADPTDEGFVRGAGSLINPASVDDAVRRIVQSVNTNRTLFNSNAVNPFGQFQRLGQVLAAPELSDGSPFLRANPALFDPFAPGGNARIFDEDYERIPQQILSLLKVGEPRFVVYAWGQSLKPARRDPDNSGPSILPADDPKFGPRGLCSNYQITGETATRAVIRVEFDRDASGQIRYDRPHAVVESFNILPVE